MKRHKIFRSNKRDRLLNRPFPVGKKSLRVIDNSRRGGFVGFYERGPFRDMLEDNDSAEILKRETYCWLFKGSKEVGALAMVEYDAGMLLDDEFAEYLDRYSMEEATFSSLICRAWPSLAEDVLIYGSVVHFTRLWVAPAYARAGEWSAIANHILKFNERRRALLVLKAFPLEYEAHGNRALKAASDRRQRALVRLYRRLLDLKPLPGPAGEAGWMYSIPVRRQHLISDPVAFDPYEPE